MRLRKRTPDEIAAGIRDSIEPWENRPANFAHLLETIGESRFVLLGEASHGTHEFYRTRAEITKHLIREKGFNAVAVEADWPAAYRANRFVLGKSGDAGAIEALDEFQRFPTWMWRNADVLDFLGWLRAHNDGHAEFAARAGFYGLDLYSLHSSIQAVLDYLARVDPSGAQRARARYSCFDHFGPQTEDYAYAAGRSRETCEDEVVSQLVDLQRRAAEYLQRDGHVAAEEFFSAEQNARLVKNAEEYYRSMFRGRTSSWNLRDTHMVETLSALVKHLEKSISRPKVVLWAHNSHLGDARATQMGERGEINVGQLMRESFPGECFLVGFSTYTGTVSASSDWDAPVERKWVRPALAGSYEELFHRVGVENFLVSFRTGAPALAELSEPRLERAIGVIYRPETERESHYFHAWLPRQFDAVLHLDRTRAVEPLERTAPWLRGEVPETFPTGE